MTKPEKEETCLISGRFDPPHRGHIKTIQDLGKRFKRVLVVVLEGNDAYWTTAYRVQVLKEILDNSKGEYGVTSNCLHFGKISIDKLLEWDFDVYAAGNPVVLKHIDEITRICETRKIRCIWVDRPYECDASTERLGQTVRDMR